MRKILLTAAVVALLAAPLAAQRITVVSPNGGETLARSGGPFAIEWTARGVDQRLKIVLLTEAGERFGLIAEDLEPGSSPYSWAVGRTRSGEAPAGRYKVRVVSDDGAVKDVSDGAFTIEAAGSPEPPPPPAPVITVTQPVSGTRAVKPGTLPIRWTREGTMGERVGISLLPPVAETVVRDICPDTANSGAYEWPLPVDLTNGRYRVRVKVAGESTAGVSAEFEITSRVKPDPVYTEFKVVSPAADERLKEGKVAPIRWESPTAGTAAMPCGDTVDIVAVRVGKAGEFAIASAAANHAGVNRLDWTPETAALGGSAGAFKIRITSPRGCRAESGVFHVEARLGLPGDGGPARGRTPAEIIGCDYGIKSLKLQGGRGLDSGVDAASGNLLLDLVTEVQWNEQGPRPGDLSLEIRSPLTGRRIDKRSLPAAFSAAQADAGGVISVTSNVAIEGRDALLAALRGRFLPAEVRLVPANDECDGLDDNNRREYSIRVLNPPMPTDLALDVEEETIEVRRTGRQSRGRDIYHLSFWVKARNLTANEAGGAGETLRNVRCSYQLLERDGERFVTLHESAFAFPEVAYGSDWRMQLTIPFELYPGNTNRLSFILVLDPEKRFADPDRGNNRQGGVFRLPE